MEPEQKAAILAFAIVAVSTFVIAIILAHVEHLED